MDIEGIAAIVTGGGSGLGEATTRALVERGASVGILDLAHSPGAALADELGERARFLEADVTSEEQVQAAVDSVTGSFGEIRAVVNCAGIGSATRTVGKGNTPFPLDVFRRSIEVNLIGSFNVIRLAAARMADNEPGDDGERFLGDRKPARPGKLAHDLESRFVFRGLHRDRQPGEDP